MAVRVQVLCESSAFGIDGVLAEHCWSAWLETPAGAYLFDTGSGRTLLNSAAVFSVSLAMAQVSCSVIIITTTQAVSWRRWK